MKKVLVVLEILFLSIFISADTGNLEKDTNFFQSFLNWFKNVFGVNQKLSPEQIQSLDNSHEEINEISSGEVTTQEESSEILYLNKLFYADATSLVNEGNILSISIMRNWDDGTEKGALLENKGKIITENGECKLIKVKSRITLAGNTFVKGAVGDLSFECEENIFKKDFLNGTVELFFKDLNSQKEEKISGEISVFLSLIKTSQEYQDILDAQESKRKKTAEAFKESLDVWCGYPEEGYNYCSKIEQRKLDYTNTKTLANSLVDRGDTEYKKVLKITEWVARNFFHAYKSDEIVTTWEVYNLGISTNLYDGKVQEKDFSGSLEDKFNQRVVGCHGASRVLVELLTQLNIVSEYQVMNGHGIVFIPSLNKYVHGDTMADYAVITEKDKLLVTKEELERHPYNNDSYLNLNISVNVYFGYPNKINYIYGPQRTGNYLFIDDFVSEDTISKENLKIIREELPEYNIKYKKSKEGIFITSDLVPIQTVSLT
jgi:hypothetical protein